MNTKKDFSNEIREGDEVASRVIPVIEEYVKVDKLEVEVGRLNIRKKIKEQDEIITVPLFHDEFNIQHVEIGKQVDGALPEVRFEGDTIVIPVLREEVIIQKRLMLVEEVRITKHKIESNYEQQVTLRKEEVVIEHK
jgi:uncharacterized protein (TIGR02271 family)